MRTAVRWVKERFCEPSTYAALAAATAAAAPYAGDWKGACLVATAFFCCGGIGIAEGSGFEETQSEFDGHLQN